MLTQAQIAEYNDIGAIVVPDVLTPAEVQTLRSVTDRFVERARGLTTHTEIYDLEDSHSADTPRVRRIKAAHLHHEAYAALTRHPKIVAALKAQADRITLTSRAFHNDQMGAFLEKLCAFAGAEMALPMNSGAEAVETALKAARKWGYEKKGIRPDEAEIVAVSENFHGRTISIVSQKDGFFVDNTGAELKHDDTGLRDRNRYLLENPVEAGRKWLSVQSVRSTEHFEITSAGSGCSTRAGTFADCVTVQSTAEVRPGRKLIIESTYAKGVGLVSLQTLQIEGSSAPQTQLELELVSYNVTP